MDIRNKLAFILRISGLCHIQYLTAIGFTSLKTICRILIIRRLQTARSQLTRWLHGKLRVKNPKVFFKYPLKYVPYRAVTIALLHSLFQSCIDACKLL